MRFVMWSAGHYLLMLAPALIMTALYFLLRKRSDKVKYFVGVVIGIISLGILLLRNIDIYLSEGSVPALSRCRYVISATSWYSLLWFSEAKRRLPLRGA